MFLYTSVHRQHRKRMEHCMRWQSFCSQLFKSSLLEEGWLLYRGEGVEDWATRRLWFDGDTLYCLGNNHAKIFTDLPDETKMLSENRVNQRLAVCDDFISFQLTLSLLLSYSANTNPLAVIFLYDLDSTLEAEMES